MAQPEIDLPPDVPPMTMGTATVKPNPLTSRFTQGPSEFTSAATSTLAQNMITPRSSLAGTNASLSLGDRAKASLKRALAGMSGLLGRPVSMPDRSNASNMPNTTPPPPAATPNILTTIPRLAPIATPPAPVGTPVTQPTPFSLNGWMAGQSAK